MTSSGIPAALGAINRKPKQETFGLIPDDGFVSETFTILNQPLNTLVNAERTQNDEL